MGKCKKRTLRKIDFLNSATPCITRANAVNEVFQIFKNQKTKSYSYALKMINMFGISSEELSEAGMSYEHLEALGCVIE